MSALRWTRQADGSWRAVGLPIVIPARDDRAIPVTVRTPQERDPNFADGWLWTEVVDAEQVRDAHFGSIATAKQWVADNLHQVMQQMADDYDGDPSAAAEASAAAAREWEERNAATRAQQDATKALYDADLTFEEEALVKTLRAMPEQRRRRVLHEAGRGS